MVTILDDDIFFGNTVPEWNISKGFDLPWPFSYIELSTTTHGPICPVQIQRLSEGILKTDDCLLGCREYTL